MKRFALHALFVLFTILYTGVSAFAGDSLLDTGIAELKRGGAEQASSIFQGIIQDSNLEAYHAEAYYWLVKTEILRKQYESAGKLVDDYLALYPDHTRRPEMRYHQARLLYLRGEPEKAIIALHHFILDYPRSQLVASTQYWIGESLIALGRLNEAEEIFKDLIKTFPASVKYEASQYRISEISFLQREKALLDFLRWNYEEYLSLAENLQRLRVESYNASREISETNAANQNRQELLEYREQLLQARERLLNLKEKYDYELMELGGNE